MMPNLPIGCLFNSPTRFSEPKQKKRCIQPPWKGHGSTPKRVLLALSLLSLIYLPFPLLYFCSSSVIGNTMIGWEGRDSLPGECFPPLRSDQPWQTSPLIRYLSVVHNTTVFLNVLFANSSLSIHMIWMMLRMDWYGGWELPTQVSSMLSRRSAMATITRTWFNHLMFMMKMGCFFYNILLQHSRHDS